MQVSDREKNLIRVKRIKDPSDTNIITYKNIKKKPIKHQGEKRVAEKRKIEEIEKIKIILIAHASNRNINHKLGC